MQQKNKWYNKSMIVLVIFGMIMPSLSALSEEQQGELWEDSNFLKTEIQMDLRMAKNDFRQLEEQFNEQQAQRFLSFTKSISKYIDLRLVLLEDIIRRYTGEKRNKAIERVEEYQEEMEEITDMLNTIADDKKVTEREWDHIVESLGNFQEVVEKIREDSTLKKIIQEENAKTIKKNINKLRTKTIPKTIETAKKRGWDENRVADIEEKLNAKVAELKKSELTKKQSTAILSEIKEIIKTVNKK